MTREALAKLNKKQIQYCTTLSVLISRDRERGVQCLVDKESGKLRGYLECLEDMKVLTNSEMKALYLWFFSEKRKEKAV